MDDGQRRFCYHPDDVSIIGIDDISLAFFARPPLTTISVPRQRLGITAFQSLDKAQVETPNVCRLFSGNGVDHSEIYRSREAPKTSNLRIDMSADPFCAQAHLSSVTTEDVLTDANGGLENVVVYISEGLGATTFPIPDEPAVMEQKGCQYKPHVLAMRAGQKLKIVNSDATTHNIHPMPNNNREWNISQPHGVPIEKVFAREEIAISVKCNVHPWMRSYIAVIKNPYFAVTGKNGSFELKDLRPGSYTLQAWHEKLGSKMQKITVGSGETKTVDFVFQ